MEIDSTKIENNLKNSNDIINRQTFIILSSCSHSLSLHVYVCCTHEINQRLVVFIEFYHRNISCFINRRGKKKKSIKCTKLTKVLAERFNLQLCIYCAQQKRLILGIFKHIKFLVELCPAMSGDYTSSYSTGQGGV